MSQVAPNQPFETGFAVAGPTLALTRMFQPPSLGAAFCVRIELIVAQSAGAEETVLDEAEEEIIEAAGDEAPIQNGAECDDVECILTATRNGYGKRSSSFEYRVTGRGGKGIVAMVVNDRNGKLVASFPALESDQLMLVTDGGQLIRVPVDAGPNNRIRIAGRSTQGVTVFNTDKDEKVVSVECINDDGEGGENGEAGDEAPGAESTEG